MKIIHSEDVELMTGYKVKSKQIAWFEREGITYRVNDKGQVWTTDDWLNGKDKYKPESDGFNMEFLQDAS